MEAIQSRVYGQQQKYRQLDIHLDPMLDQTSVPALPSLSLRSLRHRERLIYEYSELS